MSTKLDLKLNTLIKQNTVDDQVEEIINTCFDYLYELPEQERLQFVLEESTNENSKPSNMSSSLHTKVINELGFNPFNNTFWTFVDLDEFVTKQFTKHERINLDSFKSTDSKVLLKEISKKIVTPNTDYTIEFEYEVRDHEYFTSHIFIDSNNQLHTLVYFDEQNGVDVDSFSLKGIIECYLESLN